MNTKKQIIDAIKLAIDDHKATAGSLVDYNFVDALRDAIRVVTAAPEVSVPSAVARGVTA